MPPRYSEEFKRDTVKQVVNHGYGATETAEWIGVHPNSLSNWVKKYNSSIRRTSKDFGGFTSRD